METINQFANQLAEAHWQYVESVLERHGVGIHEIDNCGFYYKTAFVHGFKHGVEYAVENKMNREVLLRQGFTIGCASCKNFFNNTCNKYDSVFNGTDLPVQQDYSKGLTCWEYDGHTELEKR